MIQEQGSQVEQHEQQNSRSQRALIASPSYAIYYGLVQASLSEYSKAVRTGVRYPIQQYPIEEIFAALGYAVLHATLADEPATAKSSGLWESNTDITDHD